jgi:large subunit ribosomal protein L2
MAVKYVVPRSSGRRKIVLIDYKKVLTATKPLKSLTKTKHKNAGRNVNGCITVRHQGGGAKRRLRDIDFKREIHDIPAVVKTVEYDPNRTSLISLVAYANGVRRYILTPKGLSVGDKIITSETADIKPGNCMKISNIPNGTLIHCIEFSPRKGGQMVKTAGASAQVLGKDETGKFTIVKLPSKEVRKIPNDCYAVVGVVANEDRILINRGKAGTSRHLGIKPTVRGSVMNPIDHKHGGGEGKQGIGHPAALSP